jgi:hypothetical protein
MGLLVNIYRSDYDSTLNVFHGKRWLTLINVEGPFEPTADAPAAEVTRGPLGDHIIIPADDMLEGVIGPMFGGTFAYSSDGRFPYGAPIRIHDRFETPAQYEALSR